MSYVRSIQLNHFRNYDNAALHDLGDQFVVLIGDNGAGKTNCLEAVSVLTPGRGLRQSGIGDMQSKTTASLWAVSSIIHDGYDDIRLGVGRDPQKPNKKIIKSDGTIVKNQSDLGDILRSVWMTPQMDGLFLQSTSERRRFFDRLVSTFDPSHIGRMTRYEKAMRQRLSVLKEAHDAGGKPDATWLDGLEHIMAETSLAIAAARRDVMGQLQHFIDHHQWNDFPQCVISLIGDVETSLETQSALMAEESVKTHLRDFRFADGQTGKTNYGVHKTDFSAFLKSKNASAAQCSTGEQKAILTAIILSYIMMMKSRYGVMPIILFDEIAAHFDTKRRDGLLDILGSLNTQIWLSGQEKSDFKIIEPHANVITLKDNRFLM